MGCGSSKIQKDGDALDTTFDKPRPAVRPPSQSARSQGRPVSGTGGGRRTVAPSQAASKAPSRTQSRTQSRNQSRTQSRTHSRSQSYAGSKVPSRRGPQAHKRRSTALGTIPDEQPPEDSTIRDEVTAFRLFIDQHSINFYHTQRDDSGASISRYIARTIISNVIEKHMNDHGVAENLAGALVKYANDPTDKRRDNHLLILCKTARMIGDMMGRHPANWTFSWHGGSDIQFPTVMRGREEFLEASY
ncbi:hypothetical protein PABG_03253 [Paracoccidioides brasiliensis Pb03]|nr:hypothetical protein PABG_03253 [Paracoccidioides brasiliensis Pb03]